MPHPASYSRDTEPLDPQGSRELIYGNERTRVYRVHAPDRAECVIHKERVGPDALARVRHETRILQRLSGLDGVPRLAAMTTPGNTLALRDTGGVALSEAIGADRLPVIELVDLGCSLALTVSGMHRRGVVHRDINPRNILLCGRDLRPILSDFDLATTFAEDRPAFVHHSEIAGTLAYLAPEQTGRTSRTVDDRADLYALGATLYELATGRLPFPGDDPLQLIHDHLVRVPMAPAEVDPSLPTGLSDIIMRLLEKEPDRRYQSAEGLAHDLSRLRELLTAGEGSSFPLGQRDFPLRLSAPSRLSGRTEEIEALRASFAASVDGQGRGLLIAGASGTGKTALIDELRPVVTARRGWFLSGKFDQYGHDGAPGAVIQVLRGLGRMLLAEPEAELAGERARILDALGSNAGLITASLPEFTALLGEVPDVISVDTIEAQAQLHLAALCLLRAVVSPARPVVIVLDDLQWAYPSSIRFIDAVLSGQALSGLLLVGAYREAEVDAVHPLTALLAKWRRLGVAPPLLRLDNLLPTDLASLLAAMLRLPPTDADRLAGAIGARTGGNPYDTIELVNALRRDGVLVPAAIGWNWDDAAIRRYVGRGEVVDLLSSRIAGLPGPARKLLQTLACLGAQVEVSLLQTAAGIDGAALEDLLAPALEDGLLILDRGGDAPGSHRHGTVRFRHDRVQQAAHDGVSPARRRAMHLSVARRLVRVSEYAVTSAGHYLSAIEAIRNRHERHRVAALFREAADYLWQTANYVAVERFLAAATRLLDAEAVAADNPVRVAIDEKRHAAFYCLGRHQEADELYAAIERRCEEPMDLIDAACVHVSSVCARGQPREAVALGLNLLQRLGLTVPNDIEAEIPHRLSELRRADAVSGGIDDLRRPEASDPRVLAIANLINRMGTPAYFADPPVLAWMVLENQRLWAEHGPCAVMVATAGLAPSVAITHGQDYRTGYRILRHAIMVGEARHYEPATARAQAGFTTFASPWFEPLENTVALAHLARERLLRAGDLQHVCMTYYSTLMPLFDSGPTLHVCSGEVDAALAFAVRTGNERATASFLAYRQMLRALRGETVAPGSLSDASFDEAAHLANLAADPSTTSPVHLSFAIIALLFRDTLKLVRHSAEVMRWPHWGTYRSALEHLVQALALAERSRSAAPTVRAALLAELDVCRDWLALRAADCPINFRHLLRLVEAERAWATGDYWDAAHGFDEALRATDPLQRPWHRALIAERAGLFHLEQGLQHIGRNLMADARSAYEAWGATAKLTQLDREHPFLRRFRPQTQTTGRHQSSGFSSDAIDLLAVLRASQALSSETSLERLQVRVIELLGAMTGATRVQVILWRNDPQGWYLSATGEGTDIIAVDQAASAALPISAIRYAERTREPLLVEDATRDGRFAGDPYIAGLDCCALLVVPILGHGAPRAMLLLENRLARGAFTTDRLDAVTLIAGQLAVSFDNALLYASLERKVAERTEALEQLSITDPLTGLANRRRFAEVIEAEWERSLRQQLPIGVAMIDVDHFKSYNDHYGHILGDACLRQIATALQQGIRQHVDLVGRYGGEEFVIILPGADIDIVRAVAERVRSAVAALQERHEGASAGVVTVSIGVAAFVPSAHTTPEHLIRAADAALYEAKRSGRNQVRGEPAAPALVPDCQSASKIDGATELHAE